MNAIIYYEPMYIFLLFLIYFIIGIFLIVRNCLSFYKYNLLGKILIIISLIPYAVLVLYIIGNGYFYDVMGSGQEIYFQHIIGGGFEFNILHISTILSLAVQNEKK